MNDPRFESLADILISHSTKLQKGEKILIEAIDVPPEMVVTLIRKAVAAGGLPFTTLKQSLVSKEILQSGCEESIKLAGKLEAKQMQEMDAYVAIRGSFNISELSDVPSDKMKLYQTHWLKPVHMEIRVPRTKWVVLRWPHPSMAQQANMSTEAFENFFFDVCTMNYGNMSKAMDPLKKRMENADRVEIKGPGTNLRFSIKGIPAIKCDGQRNIPDGELFTAPVKESVEGVISFNTETIFQGTKFENITLEFEKGKIIKATGNKPEKINTILDSDEGARYVGEFSFGFNPYITKPMLDILFDEKIAGSFHFTPGAAYDEADNGNRSEVHWDMVMIQTEEYGGGEIYFDGELIRKNGLFVPEDLKPLNPDALKGNR